jgi:hypothetical protein
MGLVWVVRRVPFHRNDERYVEAQFDRGRGLKGRLDEPGLKCLFCVIPKDPFRFWTAVAAQAAGVRAWA